MQDNHSRSVAGTLRGLHLQLGAPMGKLVRVVVGANLRRRGRRPPRLADFGQWVGVTLSADNFRQCYIPPGFAHGFCVETPVAEVEYKCTALYDRSQEIGVAWNSPELGIRLAGRPRRSCPSATRSCRRSADALATLPHWPGAALILDR